MKFSIRIEGLEIKDEGKLDQFELSIEHTIDEMKLMGEGISDLIEDLIEKFKRGEFSNKPLDLGDDHLAS